MVISGTSECNRCETSYVNKSERFINTNDNFAKQYCNLYIVRLKEMGDLIQERINQKWGDSYPVCKLHKLAEEYYPKCVIFGTLFKDQKLKPSILRELSEVNSLIPQPIYDHYTDESDSLYIEDEQQRYQLLGDKIDKKLIVTGVVCALLGSDQSNGKFLVEDYCFVDLRPQISKPIIEEDLFVVLTSGLDLEHSEKSSLQLNLFIDWIRGLCDVEQARRVVRLIIAGNCIQSECVKYDVTFSMTSKNSKDSSVQGVECFDEILLNLCSSLSVDVMPGENDPSNLLLPQKPFHKCMFPKSRLFKSMNCVPNPYDCEIGGVRFLGSSGQPVDDILKLTDISEPIEALESTLKWSHLAPTAPDTLGCFPFYDLDPFIIKHCPHVMFAGNQEKFDTKIVTGPENQEVRLVCVPKFYKSRTIVLLNLRTLNCIPMNF